MKALIYKCVIELKYKIMVMIIALAFAFMLLSGEYNFIYVMVAFLMSSTIAMSVLYFDEKSHWNKYENIFPISRKAIVSQSYLLAVIIDTAMFLIVALLRVIGLIINEMPASFINIIEIVPAYLCGFAVISVVLFFVYTFNYSVGMIIYMIICSLIGAVGGYFFSSTIEDNLSTIQIKLGTLNDKNIMMYLIISAVSVAAAVISWIMAVKVYSKKEL